MFWLFLTFKISMIVVSLFGLRHWIKKEAKTALHGNRDYEEKYV